MGILLTTDTAFATIAGDELTAAGEFVDGQTTVVGTALTFCHTGLELQVADLLIIQHGGHITVLVMLSGDQRRTEKQRPHRRVSGEAGSSENAGNPGVCD